MTYKRYRNLCNNILHKLKNDYDKTNLENSRGDIKKTWDVIKHECNLGVKDKSQVSTELVKQKSTPRDSVDYFC